MQIEEYFHEDFKRISVCNVIENWTSIYTVCHAPIVMCHRSVTIASEE